MPTPTYPTHSTLEERLSEMGFLPTDQADEPPPAAWLDRYTGWMGREDGYVCVRHVDELYLSVLSASGVIEAMATFPDSEVGLVMLAGAVESLGAPA